MTISGSRPCASSGGDGSEGRLQAKVFALGANAMEIPRLLLASRSESHPNGLANSSDQVGRNLMDHPATLTWALADEPAWPFRGPLSTSGIDATRANPRTAIPLGPIRLEINERRLELADRRALQHGARHWLKQA